MVPMVTEMSCITVNVLGIKFAVVLEDVSTEELGKGHCCRGRSRWRGPMRRENGEHL